MFSLSYFLSYDVFVAEEFLSTAIATNYPIGPPFLILSRCFCKIALVFVVL
jgi:hypothetical protein